MSEALFEWCVDQLHHRFGLEACEDIVKYILTIENQEELEEYVGDLLQGTDGRKRHFIDELLKRWKRTQRPSMDTKSKRKGRNKEVLSISQAEPEPEAVKTPIDQARVNMGSLSSSKKKNKFVNLYAKEGQDKLAVLLPGRHACECLAQKHKLINNCISCGRIVCEQEGSGPCLFCGSLVCTKEEQEILQRDSNKSQKLRKKLMGDDGERDYLPHQEAKMKAGLEKAVQHKDKLLEFDRNSVKRTQVLDDESDYFATDSNQWLSPGEREKLRRREEELREIRHASRKDRKITLDFAGRQVIEEGDGLKEYYRKLDETLKAMNSDPSSPMFPRVQGNRPALRDLVNPNIMQSAPEVLFTFYLRHSSRPGAGAGAGCEERFRLRLQDKELQEMSDGGWCLSMHQPWASLLVRGIKRVEGRTWYTSHRGRLWIAAAAKKPTPQEIAEVENMYRHIYKKVPAFPKDYPTGCLLGCVNVTDCLSQEQFREQCPDVCEESASPFVFLCSSPQELLVKFPMKGKHKICESSKRGLMCTSSALQQPRSSEYVH
uniref:Activating signal cointegrator 1 n=1 Tax=Periophthalmus magnuspinnatus TaxID=409849 RepID=A0A3B4B1T5_9GOBI